MSSSLLSTTLLFSKEVGDSCTPSSQEMVQYLPFREWDFVGVVDNSQLGNLRGQRLWKSWMGSRWNWPWYNYLL